MFLLTVGIDSPLHAQEKTKLCSVPNNLKKQKRQELNCLACLTIIIYGKVPSKIAFCMIHYVKTGILRFTWFVSAFLYNK